MRCIRPTTFRTRTHAFVALMFLAVMLVEWGSHGLAFAHAGSPQGLAAMNSPTPEHDDPCRTLTNCCESRKNGGAVVTPAHNLPSFNSFAESIRFVPAYSRDVAAGVPVREDVRRIFRPKDPLLHPPELS